MSNVDQLNEAFNTFTAASRSLEASYAVLAERVAYLTQELELRNRQLKEALDEAERNKNYLNAVLYNLEESIIVVNPEGSVTMMNRSAEDLLGIALLNAYGRPFDDLDIVLIEEGAETILQAGRRRHTVILSRSDVVDGGGSLRGRVILIKDITRLRELEQRQERNQRLIAMGEMAARIVHEIRNPLCSIELFSSMLEKDLTSPVQKDLAHGISTGISNMNTILSNMLFFARPNRAVTGTMRLDTVVGESLSLLQPMLESRQVRVVQSLPECRVTGDAELLKQVFMNILINAVQAMPDGGTVTAVLDRHADTAVVRISDTGSGIPQENLEKIFDPFFTTKDDGTGLGLAIVNTIMQANNGYIKATSEEGKGSTFSLFFPLAGGNEGAKMPMNEGRRKRDRE